MKKAISFIIAAVLLAGAVSALPSFAAKAPFEDVEEDRWSASSVRYVLEAGYMQGVGDERFDPEGTLTRAMVVTVLWRRQGEPAAGSPSSFSDVEEGEWYSDAVAWAREAGVVLGKADDSFDPDGPVTREQLAAMLYRYSAFCPVSVPERADLSGYGDEAAVSAWAKEAVRWAVSSTLIEGTDEDTLDPSGPATREQFAAVIERFDDSFTLAYNKPIVQSRYTEPEYPLVDDADFYVSTEGSDDGDGTFGNPFRTWERARDAVRTLDRTGRDGIKVAFMAGEYGPISVALTAEDAGTEECPVTYCKYGDGDVVFSGGVTLKKEDFAPLSDEEMTMFPAKAQSAIMKFDLDGFFPDGMPEGLAIFGDGGTIWEARNPNKYPDGSDQYMKNILRLPESVPNYFGMEVSIAPAMARILLGKVNYFRNMKMTGYIMYGWRVDTFYVESFDKATSGLIIDGTRLPSDFDGVGIRTPQMLLDEIFFENSPDFLDSKDEYWYDPDTNDIYVYDPGDEYTIGLGGTFLTLSGADFVTLLGLSFKNNRDANAIIVSNSEHVTVDRCEISGVYRPIESSGSSDWFTVKNSEFSRFIANCLNLRQSTHRTTLESNHVLIDNNYIHDYGLSKIFNNQAIADGTVGAVISHNVFENSPNGAINLGMLSVIEYNVFDNMMTSTQDFGVIYTWNAISSARHNTIRYNLFNEMAAMNGATYGLYMDDFTQDQLIYGNLFYRCGGCGVMLHNARDQFVYENAFIHSTISTNGFGFFEDGKVNDGLLPDGTGWSDLYRRYYLNRVNEGEDGYEIWKSTFPSLYAFTPDIENPYVYESIFCPWDSIHNNVVIGGKFNVAQEVRDYGEVYDNEIFDTDENRYFVNPTLGDYRLNDGVDFFYIPYELIGRY